MFKLVYKRTANTSKNFAFYLCMLNVFFYLSRFELVFASAKLTKQNSLKFAFNMRPVSTISLASCSHMKTPYLPKLLYCLVFKFTYRHNGIKYEEYVFNRRSSTVHFAVVF